MPSHCGPTNANAYASFLAAAEEVRIALGPTIRLVGAYLEEGVGTGQAATDARNELQQCYKEFVYRQSALRLSVDDPEVERAWALVSLVGTVLDHFDTWSDALNDHGGSDAAWAQFNDSRGRFEADLAAWATSARAQLAEHRPSCGDRTTLTVGQLPVILGRTANGRRPPSPQVG